MTARQTKELWCNLVDDKFKGEAEYYGAIVDKLMRLKFGNGQNDEEGFPGNIHPKHSKHRKCQVEDMSCPLCYVRKHFGRSLLREFAIRLQADIPARSKRTRLEHHSPKQDQLRLDRGNQLPLF